MNNTQDNNSTVKDRLGLATGLLTAFSWIMPVHSYTMPFFTAQVMAYMPWGTEWLWSIIWGACLVFFMVSAVRFAVLAVISMITTFFSMLAVKFTLWRSSRRYK
jgi:hypothetical protein